MTCPHDSRACVRPRCAVCPLIELTEAEALPALFAVARLTGGYVNGLAFWRTVKDRDAASSYASDVANIGYGVMGAIDHHHAPIWMWLRADGTFGHRLIADLGLPGVVLPMGRVDRGLGAITSADMKPAQPQRLRTPRAGPECPTD